MGRRSKHRREMTANLVKALKERGKLGEVLEVDPKNRASRNIQALIADVANEIAKEEKMPIVNPSQTKQILADVKKDQKTIQSIERFIRNDICRSKGISPIGDCFWDAHVCYWLARGHNLRDAKKRADQALS